METILGRERFWGGIEDVNGDGDGDEAGTVEARQRTPDGKWDGGGDGAGTGMRAGTGVEIRG